MLQIKVTKLLLIDKPAIAELEPVARSRLAKTGRIHVPFDWLAGYIPSLTGTSWARLSIDEALWHYILDSEHCISVPATPEELHETSVAPLSRSQQYLARGLCRFCPTKIHRAGYCKKHYDKHVRSVREAGRLQHGRWPRYDGPPRTRTPYGLVASVGNVKTRLRQGEAIDKIAAATGTAEVCILKIREEMGITYIPGFSQFQIATVQRGIAWPMPQLRAAARLSLRRTWQLIRLLGKEEERRRLCTEIITLTPIQQRTLQILTEMPGLSAQDITDELKRRGIRTSESAVSKALEVLKDTGSLP